MHLRADVGDVLLEHTVRGRVGDHQDGELVGVLLDLGAEVRDVDLAVVGRLHHDDLHTGHHGARGVRAVRGGRDEADGALVVAVGAVVAADREQTGQLALGTGVRLERHVVVAGDLRETLLQLTDEREVALRLVGGREGVQLTELGPGDRLHLRRRVELHRAGAQRDHAAVERVVTVGQLAQVAQHRGLGAVRVEHGVRQVVVATQEALGQRVHGRRVERVDIGLDTERGPHGAQLGTRRGLVARDRHMVGVDEVEVDAAFARGAHDIGGPARDLHGQGVEVRAVHDLHTMRP